MKLIMKMLLTVLIFMYSIFSYGQHKDEIYRIADTMYSTNMKTYNVNVLILDSDGSYELQRQQYHSKREMKKNIILDFSKEKGSWNKEKDTLYLKSSDTNQETKFFILNKNKIATIIEDIEISPSSWKRVKI